MSSKQSFLSSSTYGYDIAVGVTQASVNATMKQYLDKVGNPEPGKGDPEAAICFVADAEGRPKLIDYDQLKKNANGADPFTIPDKADPATNKDIINLKAARFITGFKARIGIPSGMAPGKIPDILLLDADTSYVTFTLMCAEFRAVQLVLDGYNPPRWVNVSQDPQSPILFTAKVNLQQIQADVNKLPKPVAKQREAFIGQGYGFTIQQLFLDLDTAFGSTTPAIAGVDPGSWLDDCLSRYFMRVYMKTLQSNKDYPTPVLGYAFKYTNPGTLAATIPITNTAMAVTPYVDAGGNRIQNPTPIQREVATLNYQCTTDNKKPLPPLPFKWNWVETNEMGDFDGVMAINRNTFANYLHNRLINLISNNCLKSRVRVWRSGFLDLQVNFSWGFERYQQPNITFSQTGPLVLSYSYHSDCYDGAGSSDWMGRMSLSPTYNVTISFSNNAIIIKQRLVIWLRVGAMANDASGNVIDRTITDTYTLTVKNNQLDAIQTSTTEDHPTMEDLGAFLNFFTGLDDLKNNVRDWLKAVVQTNLQSLPLSVVQDFIFPGGNAFAFKKVMFSDNQDLIAHITYLAPETAAFLKTPRKP